jgi:putative oxidoreductase
MLDRLSSAYRRAADTLASLAPPVDLLLRLWVAGVFLKSGLTKIGSWQGTLYLFENEYHVPLLPPEIAAYAGTATELIVPVFLALGLGTRFFAVVLFAFNAIAVVSYPGLSEGGLRDHVFWGVMMLVTIVHGAGRLSVDHLLRGRVLAPRQGAATWAH